ncbi:hypothetical protein Nepgr_018661 [Nepenthes gracilis]|uniref:RING-type domain-containing protein n=1 Tax=Nepenthes gracilis TaxID=150966 RepID=A0AAD3SRW3_NEPGR|nr:hypothetical protein Nepgr_018661 [Nepenthes gracilis]
MPQNTGLLNVKRRNDVVVEKSTQQNTTEEALSERTGESELPLSFAGTSAILPSPEIRVFAQSNSSRDLRKAMVSDSIISASIPIASKEFGKKKRANRTAKLKQCKLDARREQWLSQVKNKCFKEDVTESGGDRHSMRSKIIHRFKNLEIRRSNEEENDISVHHDCDFESPANSPTSVGYDLGNNFVGSSSCSNSSSSFGGGGCCSGSVTEEEEGGGGGDDHCLDDWEAAADALAAITVDKQPQKHCTESSAERNVAVQLVNPIGSSNGGNVAKEKVGTTAVNNRAWKSDDAFRPRSLPNLSKQRCFPMTTMKHCVRVLNPTVSVPKSCPICCEDLDLTDSRFLPCSCGFRLCLFCHKRILEEDGRCPGCRKPYDSNPIRLARSCSMFSRT